MANSGIARMSTDATFRIASCTKTFTAASVLRLAEEGSVDLGDRTIQHVLQHTSGLPDMDREEFMEERYDRPDKVWTPWEKIERSIIGRHRTGPPGPPARYCDVGYVLLAVIIEASTGRPLPQAFRSYVVD
jgi:D-alanyl-D-alanine carboxypeptidase